MTNFPTFTFSIRFFHSVYICLSRSQGDHNNVRAFLGLEVWDRRERTMVLANILVAEDRCQGRIGSWNTWRIYRFIFRDM